MKILIIVLIAVLIIAGIGAFLFFNKKKASTGAPSLAQKTSSKLPKKPTAMQPQAEQTSNDRDNIVAESLNNANTYIENQRYDDAEVALKKGLLSKPDSGELSLKLLNVYMLTNDRAEFDNLFLKIQDLGDPRVTQEAMKTMALMDEMTIKQTTASATTEQPAVDDSLAFDMSGENSAPKADDSGLDFASFDTNDSANTASSAAGNDSLSFDDAPANNAQAADSSYNNDDAFDFEEFAKENANQAAAEPQMQSTPMAAESDAFAGLSLETESSNANSNQGGLELSTEATQSQPAASQNDFGGLSLSDTDMPAQGTQAQASRPADNSGGLSLDLGETTAQSFDDANSLSMDTASSAPAAAQTDAFADLNLDLNGGNASAAEMNTNNLTTNGIDNTAAQANNDGFDFDEFNLSADTSAVDNTAQANSSKVDDAFADFDLELSSDVADSSINTSNDAIKPPTSANNNADLDAFDSFDLSSMDDVTSAANNSASSLTAGVDSGMAKAGVAAGAVAAAAAASDFSDFDLSLGDDNKVAEPVAPVVEEAVTDLSNDFADFDFEADTTPASAKAEVAESADSFDFGEDFAMAELDAAANNTPAAVVEEEPVAATQQAPVNQPAVQAAPAQTQAPVNQTANDFAVTLDTSQINQDINLAGQVDNSEVTLGLAGQYLELGEYDSAKRLLDEVIKSGNPQQVQQANGLLAQFG